MQESYLQTVKKRWKQMLVIDGFAIKLLTAIIIFVIGALQFPNYFLHIQKREGEILNDFVLNNLPALDVSTPIFAIIYGLLLYMLARVITKPNIFLLFALTFVIETVFRMTTIYIFPLNAPENLVFLHDTFAEALIYGDSEPITKDLFFSGHTATMVMIWLFVDKPWEKIIALIGGCMLAFLLLVQHVHYTADVVGAFFFTYLSYLIAQKIVDMKWQFTTAIMIVFYVLLQTIFQLGSHII